MLRPQDKLDFVRLLMNAECQNEEGSPQKDTGKRGKYARLPTARGGGHAQLVIHVKRKNKRQYQHARWPVKLASGNCLCHVVQHIEMARISPLNQSSFKREYLLPISSSCI